MHVIRVRNVQQALPAGLAYLEGYGCPEDSRNGPVTVAPGPVTTVYDNPCEHVLFWPGRDSNPFFHFFEALWILAGRNDLAFLTRFVKRFADYSDDGLTLAGAYGDRWRKWPTTDLHPGTYDDGSPNVIAVTTYRDQLERAIELLRADWKTRRAVVAMWDPNRDLFPAQGKDVCCNTQLMFRVTLGKANEANRLNMMVTCRSNDIIWGAYGANAVHFSFVQEYVAAHLGLVVGSMTQVSWNYHAYLDVFQKTCKGLAADCLTSKPFDPYEAGEVTPYPLAAYPEDWDADLKRFFEIAEARSHDLDPPLGRPYHNTFFYEVARPLWWAHEAYRHQRWVQAQEILAECKATDWRRACEEWIERRRVAHFARER